MIYMYVKNGQHVIILEPANLDHLRVGGIVKTPDQQHSVIITFQPDIIWAGERLREIVGSDHGIDLDQLEALLTEGQHRPEVRERPYHHVEHFSGRKEKS